jgi:hypothetical protein
MRRLSRAASDRATRRAALAVVLIGLGAVGCGGDGLTGPRPLPVTISGSLINRSGAAIPPNARVVVLWSSDDGSGDYAYVFGEGTIDRATNRFTVTFDRDIPRAASYDGALGVGLVVLTTDPNLHEGRVPDGYDYASTVIGATGQHAVIYLGVAPSEFGSDWAAAFRPGYNVGRGVDLPGTFDGFAPAELTSMELIVDDLRNIEFVNWT